MAVNTHGSALMRGAAVAVLCVFGLSACDGAREAMGLSKQSPDEFAVVTRAPLSLPPDFGLRPPRPGADRPQEASVKDSARDMLTGAANSGVRTVRSTDVSRGEAALLARAGATSPDPNVRTEINRESSILATGDDGFFDSLIFWQPKPPPGTVVDADREAQRLRENAALGNSPTTGRSPTIERREKGWLEGIVN